VPAGPSGRATPTLRAVFLLGVSVLGIVLIVLGVLIVLFLIGGVVAVVVRSRRGAGTYDEHVAAADAMLEQARAADKGWHRDTMEAAAREAIAESRPEWSYEDLHLVFVDDRPENVAAIEFWADLWKFGPPGMAEASLSRSSAVALALGEQAPGPESRPAVDAVRLTPRQRRSKR
jgi:hypothetical protein